MLICRVVNIQEDEMLQWLRKLKAKAGSEEVLVDVEC